jgi:DnaJ-class molecular chaperone
MGLGSRLYHVLRANVGHYLREATTRFRGGDAGDPGRFSGESESAGPGFATEAGSEARFARDYRLLELPYGSGRDAVRSAHRRLLRRFHPDRFARDPDGLTDATRLSQEITAARDRILSALESGEIRPTS